MRNGILIKFGNKYSGGRYHGWMIALALAKFSKVDIFCDKKPIFFDDFKNDINIDKINFKKINSIKNCNTKYQWFFCIPSISTIPYYNEFISKCENDKTKIALINFETPNWYNSYFSKNVHRTDDMITFLAENSSVCLSATSIGTEYAKNYFKKIDHLNFENFYPSINTTTKIQTLKKKQSITLFARFGSDSFSKHKLSINIEDLFIKKFKDYTLNIIYSGSVNKEKIIKEGRKFGINVVFHSQITDKQKFDLIAQSEFMIFLSLFEGFGYPPIESLACNTPVYCNELPVFKEVHEDRIFYIDNEIDKYDFFQHRSSYNSYQELYLKKFSIEEFSKNLKYMFKKYEHYEKNYPNNSFYTHLYSFIFNSNIKSKVLLAKSFLEKQIS